MYPATDRAYGETDASAQANGLLLLANRISEASTRVRCVSDSLSSIALGIHGPRPENGAGQTIDAPSKDDSIAARVSGLVREIERLERQLNSLVR